MSVGWGSGKRISVPRGSQEATIGASNCVLPSLMKAILRGARCSELSRALKPGGAPPPRQDWRVLAHAGAGASQTKVEGLGWLRQFGADGQLHFELFINQNRSNVLISRATVTAPPPNWWRAQGGLRRFEA
jgi:hypothetical protein